MIKCAKFYVDLHVFVVDERDETTRRIRLCMYPRVIAMQIWEPRRERDIKYMAQNHVLTNVSKLVGVSDHFVILVAIQVDPS